MHGSTIASCVARSCRREPMWSTGIPGLQTTRPCVEVRPCSKEDEQGLTEMGRSQIARVTVATYLSLLQIGCEQRTTLAAVERVAGSTVGRALSGNFGAGNSTVAGAAAGQSHDPDEMEQMVAQVMEMGFESAQAETALNKTGWCSVEAAINHLFG